MTDKAVDAEETRRERARQLRYRKPIVRDLNLDAIAEGLREIQEECEDVRWYVDADDETLVNALDGDEDEAYEFRVMFSDLCAECERMREDLGEAWVPDCFDRFFVAAGAGEDFGGILGFDSYAQDYLGIVGADSWAEDEARKSLRRLTKDDLIEAARQCFRVYQGYVSLRYRYDCLKAGLDILHDQNTGCLQMVRRIEELYERAEEDSQGFRYDCRGEFDRVLECLPQEAWIQ